MSTDPQAPPRAPLAAAANHGREPRILHSAGASNGHIYVARDPRIPVLMSSPAMGAAHAPGECLDSSSLDAYHQLCYETARMNVDREDG